MGNLFLTGATFCFLSKPVGHEQKNEIENCAHAHTFLRSIGMSSPFESIFIKIMEHRGLRRYIVSVSCADGGLVFNKFKHIAGNAPLNLDKTHCVVLFELGITCYHENRRFKNFSKSHKFKGEIIKETLCGPDLVRGP